MAYLAVLLGSMASWALGYSACWLAHRMRR
jgi:hypothetical protein